MLGAKRMADETGQQIDALLRGDLSHLADAAVFELAEPTEVGQARHVRVAQHVPDKLISAVFGYCCI